MTLILFDVDGTLTATNACDAKCYALAFERVFGMPLPTTDWDQYVHATDSGIIHEVMEKLRGSKGTSEEIAAFERAFVEELEKEFAANPGGFNEIPGAKAILAAIHARPGFAAGIASGGMRASACYKLSRIGVDGMALPSSYANDDVTREGIARCAMARAEDPGEDVVYVGDGPWDVRTSAAIGMRFIGVTGDAAPEWTPLYNQGATVCIRDFQDQDAFFRAVESARTPQCPRPG